MPNPWSKEEQERINGIGASAMTVREQEHRESVHDDLDTNTGEAPQESGMGAEAAKQREDEMLADAHKAIPAESPSTVYSEGVDPAEAQRQFNEKLQNGYFSAIANREIPDTGDVDMDAFSVRAMRVVAAENGMELPPDEELMPPKKEEEPVDPAEEGDAISQEEAEQSVEVAKTSVDVIRDSAEQIMDIVKELGDSVEELSDAPTEENLEMAEEMDAGMLPGEDTQADEQRPAVAAAKINAAKVIPFKDKSGKDGKVTVSKATNFHYRITKEEAERLFHEHGYDIPFVIMCKEYGPDYDWMEIWGEDLHDADEKKKKNKDGEPTWPDDYTITVGRVFRKNDDGKIDIDTMGIKTIKKYLLSKNPPSGFEVVFSYENNKYHLYGGTSSGMTGKPISEMMGFEVYLKDGSTVIIGGEKKPTLKASKEGSIADSSTPKAEGEDEEALKDGTKGRADVGGKLVEKKLTDKAGKVEAKSPEGVILFADGARGIYIPQYFAQSIKKDLVKGVSDEDWEILEAGPDHEFYMETWDDVERKAEVILDGHTYTLTYGEGGGDLFLICPELMTPEEKENFGMESDEPDQTTIEDVRKTVKALESKGKIEKYDENSWWSKKEAKVNAESLKSQFTELRMKYGKGKGGKSTDAIVKEIAEKNKISVEEAKKQIGAEAMNEKPINDRTISDMQPSPVDGAVPADPNVGITEIDGVPVDKDDLSPKAVKAIRAYASMHRRIDDADFGKVCAGLGVTVEAGKKVLAAKWREGSPHIIVEILPDEEGKYDNGLEALNEYVGSNGVSVPGPKANQHRLADLPADIEEKIKADPRFRVTKVPGKTEAANRPFVGKTTAAKPDDGKFTIDGHPKGSVDKWEVYDTADSMESAKKKAEKAMSDGWTSLSIRWKENGQGIAKEWPTESWAAFKATASLRKDYLALTAQKMPHAEAIRVVASLYKVDAAKAERVVAEETASSIEPIKMNIDEEGISVAAKRNAKASLSPKLYAVGLGANNRGGVDKIVEGLNAVFQKMKKANPKGFMDEFESRFSTLLWDVAQEVGGNSMDQHEDTYVVSFDSKLPAKQAMQDVLAAETRGDFGPKAQGQKTVASDLGWTAEQLPKVKELEALQDSIRGINLRELSNEEFDKLKKTNDRITQLMDELYEFKGLSGKGKKDDDDKPEGGKRNPFEKPKAPKKDDDDEKETNAKAERGGECNRPFAHSRVADRRASAGLMDGKQVKWDIYFAGKKKKSMLFPPSFDKRQVVDTLVEKYGYHPDTTVKKAEDQTVRGQRSATAVSKGEIEDMIRRFNEAGSNFRLGETYGQYDLWATDKEGKEHRLESGSANDIKQALIKYRFNEKYQKATAADDMYLSTEKNRIGETILQQLGGNKFTVMTGAVPRYTGEGSLVLSLPRGAKNGINTVTIIYNEGLDTYDMLFRKVVRTSVRDVARVDDVQADQLRHVFTNHTGLETSLGTMRGQKVLAENTAALDELREIQNWFSKNPIKDMPTDTYKKMSGEIKKKSDRMRELMAVLYDETPLPQAATASKPKTEAAFDPKNYTPEERQAFKDEAMKLAKEQGVAFNPNNQEEINAWFIKNGDEITRRLNATAAADPGITVSSASSDESGDWHGDIAWEDEKGKERQNEFVYVRGTYKEQGGKEPFVNIDHATEIPGYNEAMRKSIAAKIEEYIKSHPQNRNPKAAAAANPIDIGDGYYAHKIGYDRNGNWAVWISKGPNPAMKIQTNGDAPEAHRARGKYKDLSEAVAALSDRARDELKDYHKRFGAKAVVKKEGGDAKPPFPAR